MVDGGSYEGARPGAAQGRRPSSSVEELIDGWPFAESFFGDVLGAADALTQNENKGIARLGRRVGRFLRFQQQRLAFVAEGLSDRQRLAFAALPYLLHVNEPDLPGHSKSRFTVHGVSNFEFNPTIGNAVRELFKQSQVRQPPAEFRPVIHSIFLMTDIGTLAQRDTDLLSIYMVVDLRSMGDTLRRDLAMRLDSLVEWAEKMGLHVEFVLVDPDWSRQGDFADLRGEPAHGFLLLERFYRMSTYLAGDMQFFWCTTPGVDLERHLKTARLAQRVDFDERLSFIDLGYVDFPPIAVRRRAMLALLNHDSDTPIAVILNLTLLVFGANAASALCEHMKSRVFKGSDTEALCDPYVNLFDAACIAVAHHAHWEALSFLRKIFILKTALKALNRSNSRRGFLREINHLKPFLLRWGWDRSVLDLASEVHRSSSKGMEAIHSEITQHILGFYRMVSTSAKESPGRFDDEEVALLGRRLIASFGRTAGRVPLLFTYVIHEYLNQPKLFFLDRPNESRRRRWAVYKNLIRREPPPGEEPLYVSDTLASVLSWVAANELAQDSTEVRVVSVESLASTMTVREVLTHLNAMLKRVDPLSMKSSDFAGGFRISSSVLLVNFEQKRVENKDVDANRRHYLAANWDVLNYGRNRDSQVQDIAVISRDNWDQVVCRRARGRDAVRVAMRHVFADYDVNGAYTAPVQIFLPEGRTQRAIQGRVMQILQSINEVIEGAVREAHHRSFAYEVGGKFQIVRRTKDAIHLYDARSLRGVIRLLSPSSYDVQDLRLDALSPTLSDLRSIRERRESDSRLDVSVGWRNSIQGGYIIIVDGTGRIYHRSFLAGQLDNLLLRVLRRIIHQLRFRVRDMRTLRKVLRVFEMRDGRGQGDEAHMYEDTVRVLRLLADPRASHPEIFLRGDFRQGRNGIYLEYNDTVYSPEKMGRRFAVNLVNQLIQDRQKFAEFHLFIEASTVKFDDSDERSSGGSIVRHLRLIDIYERLLVRALKCVRGSPTKVMLSKEPFGGERKP
ncbi:MAG: class I adenylate cyclase [Myxococcota bacterium]|nr:class I adenylate cyclase [Myxococcota bacterium]